MINLQNRIVNCRKNYYNNSDDGCSDAYKSYRKACRQVSDWGELSMNVKIYTMTHKPFLKPDDPVYIPLHVGREISQDLGYMGDNTGEHISDLNPYYGELTGLYWIWRNETEADIIGVCHYRRFFMNENGSFMSAADYEAVLTDCDVLLSDLAAYGGTNRENFAKTHNLHDMEAVGEAIRKLYPEDYNAFCRVMDDKKCCYGNLMVARKEIFDAYCEWLFNVLVEASEKIDPEIEKYDIYHQRVYGFLSAVLLYVWVTARGLRIREGKIGITAEKAETVEFKQAMAQLISMADIAQAKELFYSYIRLRPDIRDNLSDIKREIPVIELLLYIMHEEQKADVDGLLAYSCNMSVLIEHYKNTEKFLQQYDMEGVREAGADYFAKSPISDIALDIIDQNNRGELSLYEYLNEGRPPKKVSVIVPVYNGEKQFGGCIGNLVHQTLEEIEIIFIDDCSTDNSLSILYECRRQYPDKVRVIASPENRKAGGARNLGLDLATGEYIGFVDCDDFPDIMMYEKLYAKAKEGDYDVVDGAYIDMEHQEIRLATKDEDTGVLDGEKRSRLIISGGYLWSRLVRRELIENHHLRFREHVTMLEDSDFLCYLFAVAYSTGNVNDVIYRYNDTAGALSKTKTQKEYTESFYTVIEAIYDRTHDLPNYSQVQEALEYKMISYYSSVVNDCIEHYLAKEKFPVLETLDRLRKLRKKVTRPGYANSYVQRAFEQMDMAIMKMNDDNPQMLLMTAKKQKWQFRGVRE